MPDHATIDPVTFDAAGLDQDTAQHRCEGFMEGIVGAVRLDMPGGHGADIHGLLCRLADLAVMTCYFPSVPVEIIGHERAGYDRILMVRSMQGRLHIRQDGRSVEADVGDLLFICGDRPFEWSLPDGGRLDCGSLSLRAARLAPEKLARLFLRPVPRNFPPLQLLITYAAYLLNSGHRSAREADMANIHFNEILPHVIGYLETPDLPPRPDRLSPVKSWIDANLANEVTVSDIAAMLGVTPRYIQKLFQQEGTTFSRFLLERRLAAARKLLLDDSSDRPISAIAYEVGFGDLSYFNRSFRKQFGTAPSQIRKAGFTPGAS